MPVFIIAKLDQKGGGSFKLADMADIDPGTASRFYYSDGTDVVEKTAAEMLTLLAHAIASHSDTTATGAELETLTDGSDASALHTHDSQVDPKAITIEDPADDEDIGWWFSDKAITVKQINDFIVGTTSVDWNVVFHANADTAIGSCSKLWNAGRTTSSTSGAETSTFDDATIPAGSWIRIVTTGLSDTPDKLSVTLHYTFD